MRTRGGILSQAGTLIAIAIGVGGTVVSLVASGTLARSESRNARTKFDSLVTESGHITEEVSFGPTHLLDGMFGLYAASMVVDRGEFEAYAEANDFKIEYPGVTRVGTLKRVASDRVAAFTESQRSDNCPEYEARTAEGIDTHWLVMFDHPVSESATARGIDLADSPQIVATIHDAIRAKNHRLSPPVDVPWADSPRMLWVRPVFKNGSPSDSGAPKLADLDVVLFAAFDPSVLPPIILDSLGGLSRIDVNVDGVPVSELESASIGGAQSGENEVVVGGRSWGLAVRSTAGFDRSYRTMAPTVFAVSGMLVSWMISAVIFASSTARRRAERIAEDMTEEIREAHKLFERAINGSREAIFDWQVAEDHTYFAPQWRELLKCGENDLKPKIETLFERIASSDVHRVSDELFNFMMTGGDTFESEFRLMADDGTVVWALLRAAAYRNKSGAADCLSGSIADISSLKAVEEEMRRLIQQDHLTGLASRSKFMDKLEHALARCRRTGEHCAVLFFDFDRFKIVNDSLGHDVGDELLCSIAARLRSNIREVDTAARFGGDEFVILLEEIPDAEHARMAADKLLKVCAEPHDIRGHQLISTASIGLITTQLGAESPTAMLRDADAAMYQAKASGRGRVVEFDEKMHQASLDRLKLEADLRHAVPENQLSLHYQPIVDLESGETVGAEALARWTHPERGMIAPTVFIHLAEESNQINAIGRFVLAEACRQLSHWRARKALPKGFSINVNISRMQLTVPSFINELDETVRSAGLTPSDIKLEVTETTIVDSRSGIAEILRRLRDRGYIIVMDDFGTGHSSLSGLQTLPIDELKIDQTFIHHERTTTKTVAITSAILTLADHLSLNSIGEGVESIDHIALLQNLGCQFGQGYYFSKPLPANEFEEWMRTGFRANAA